MQEPYTLLTDRPARRLVDWPMVWIVWVCCLGYSSLQTPVPGVNEPHYLAMARSFVDPAWCNRDPFLQSHPVHWVFFTLLGWPTYWWGFETAAILGRLLGYGLLAVGWVALVRQLVGTRWGTVGVLLGMLLIMLIGNFSGEWLIGGIEGKVFSYAAVFGSLACLISGEITMGALWGGVAIAFHPVVGMWHLLASVGTFGILKLRGKIDAESSHEQSVQPKVRQGRRRLYWGIAFVLGLVGFLPAAYLLVHVSPEIAYQGTRIQVYRRLAHHLNPLVFPATAYWCYGGLLVAFVFLQRFVPRTRPWQICAAYVGWCVVFALAGIIVGCFPRWFPGTSLDRLSPRLLKFYPFRMADLLLPWFVVLGVWELLSGWLGNQRRLIAQLVLTAILVCGIGVWQVLHPVRSSSMTASEEHDWLEACEWVRKETPGNALFLTTRKGWAFKWYAERAEYFSHKDTPQDAAGLIAWEERQRLLWELFAEKFSGDNLKLFREKTGTDFVLIGRGTPCNLPPVHENGSFAIYDLRNLNEPVARDQ
ncbi:MAG: hypothetical protein KDA68_01080 [Planctomycetaceae bacterium]|nr:hypothetical protein [Planctomycetaceae bacterium]